MSPRTLLEVYFFTISDVQPVEERLAAFTFEPEIVVNVQVVAITMAWVNLQVEEDRLIMSKSLKVLIKIQQRKS